MEFSWLEDLVALADFSHFSRAAEFRNVSQPAFSRRVKNLEEWVGVPLVNRDTHRAYLTPAGEEFLTVAEEVLRRLASGREQACDAASGSAATLRFASTHALSLLFFPTWLQRVDEASEEEHIVSLITDNMTGCERLLIDGRAQFLLCHHHPSTSVAMRPAQFQSLDIGRDILRPVCIPKAGSREPLFPLPGTSEAPLPYLAYSPISGMGRIVGSSQALDGPHAWLNTAFTSHVAAVLTTMARRGKGVAWLPVSLIANDLDQGLLVPAGDESWDIPISIRLYRPQARQSPAAETFWKRVRQFVAEQGLESLADAGDALAVPKA